MKPTLDWTKLTLLIDRWLNEADREAREDMRQTIILTMLEGQKRDGFNFFPGIHYCKKVAKARAHKTPQRRMVAIDDMIGEQTLSLSYLHDFEAMIDLHRIMLKEAAVPQKKRSGGDNISGMIFGDWVAKDDVGINKHGKVIWSIVCRKCGEKKTALAAHLKRGAIRWCTKDRSGRSAAYAAKASAQAAANRKARRESQ